MSKGNLTFLHKVQTTNVHDGKVVVHEEEVIHGEKGLKIKYYHKEDNKIVKFVAVQKEDGSFIVIETADGAKGEGQSMSKDDVIELLKKNKHLKFALDYVKTVKGGRKMSRSRRGSKKGSKKASRKGSRKATGGKRRSRKGSKKASKKGSKRGSRKMSGGKRRSRRGSKKGSKKASRKGSRK